jgi:hypothetical protein
MAAVPAQEDLLYETLSRVIRNAFFDARNAGETMYKASEDAAAQVLSVMMPSALRLQVEMDRLVTQWEKDRATYPDSGDWQSRVSEVVLGACIDELRRAIARAKPMQLELEPVPETG